MHSIISFFASIDPELYNIAIFVAFLVYNLILGLRSSKGITTFEDFALGGRNFSTATLASTIIATWVGGTFLFTIVFESYKNGLYYVWPSVGAKLIYFLLIALVFAPRMGEFLGKLSVAEAMGSVYGERVRIITAVSGFIGVVGFISVQLKVAGTIFEYALGVSGTWGVVIIGSLITIYSTLGGVRAVTFTDIIQFITFGVVIPIILYLLLYHLKSVDDITYVFKTNPLFNYKEIFDFSRSKSIYYLFLFFFLSIPGFNPAIFQRISMARNTIQVKYSFAISAFVCFFLGTVVCAI